jgi:DNA-binding SARP family transcriptional activator/nucleoid-associated protein YgaU
MRYFRALGAAGVLLLILGGFPLALAATIGNPLPGWRDLGAGDVSDTALLALLSTLAWMAWAYFTATVLLETLYLARQRTGLRTPRPAPERRLARTLLTAMFVALPLTGSSQALAASLHPPAAPPAAVAAPTHHPGLSPTLARVVDAATVPATPTTSSLRQAPRLVTTTVTPRAVREYVIQRQGPGTYWALAQTYLGDGQRWNEIWALNKGRVQSDGTRLRTPGLLQVGWTILLPTTSTEDTPSTTATNASASTDPVNTAGIVQETGTRLVYVVLEGDRLGAIAERFLGHFAAYERIRDANTDLMPSRTGPRGPDHIQPGWQLTLPIGARDHGRIPHATGRAHHHTAKHGREPFASSPTPRPSEAPRTSPRPGPTNSTSLPASTPKPSMKHPASPGVSIPGGWIDLPLAAALAAAASAVWIRRRMVHLYPPFEEDPDDGRDGDLQALPAVMTRVRRAIREHAEALPLAFPAPRDPSHQTSALPSLATAGGYPDPLAGAQIPPAGLGLVGTGAPAAARALLVAALSAPATSGRRGQVILTRTAVNALLPGASESDLGEHMIISVGPDDACSLLEGQLEERDDGAMPGPLLLITEVPPPRLRPRLKRVIRDSASLTAHTVVLGNWEPDPTITVESDGSIADSTMSGGIDRVAVLDEPTTISFLQVLQETPSRRQPTPSSPRATPPRSGMDTPHSAVPEAIGSVQPPEPGTDFESRIAQDATGSDSVQESHSPGRVPVRVLGQPTIFRPDGTPVSGLRRHAVELLVYLAVHRDGARLSDIMEAVWPEATVRRAQQRLSTEVADLRRNIRIAAADPDRQPVVNTGGHYHLDPETLDIDLWRLEDHLAAAAATDPDQRARHLRTAVEALTDVLAEDCDYDWIDEPREHLRRQSIRALLALSEHPDTSAQEAASLTTRAADLDPANEDLTHRAMRALAAVGDTKAIPERLQRLRDLLRDIGEQPSPHTLALAAQLSAPTLREVRQ